MDDIESQSRSNNLIISGGVLIGMSSDKISQSFVQLFKQKVGVELPHENILSSYRIGAKKLGQAPDSRKLLIKLRDGDTKRDILSAFRTKKPADFYANEDLIPLRAKLLYLLRRAKPRSNGKLVACGSSNGNVYAFIKPINDAPRNQKIFVKNMDKLESLCEKEFEFPLSVLTGEISNQ